MSNEFPRRCSMLRWVAAERAIYEATQVVERMGADVRLTQAVILLGQARDRVADYVDGVNAPPPAQQSTPPVPEEMPETVRRTIAEIREVDGEYRLSDVHFTAQWLADENKRLADRLDAREREYTQQADAIGRLVAAAHDANEVIRQLRARAEQAERDRAELAEKLNAPELHDFASGVVLEAAHQRERWGAEHDAGKEPADWFWLIGYLAGKALAAHLAGNVEKALHHAISAAAAANNWHAAILGRGTMRPGLSADVHAAIDGPTAVRVSAEPMDETTRQQVRDALLTKSSSRGSADHA